MGEIIKFKAGFLCETNFISIYQSLKDLIKDPSILEEYSKNARKLCLTNYDTFKNSEKLSLKYKELLLR